MDFIVYFIAFFFGMFLGGIIIYQISKDKVVSILHEEKSSNHYKNKRGLFKFIGLIEVLKNSNGGYTDQSKRVTTKTPVNKQNTHDSQKINDSLDDSKNFEKEFKAMEKKHNKCVAKLASLVKEDQNTYSTDIDHKSLETEPERSNTKPIKTTYYSIPQSNGSFKFDNGKELKDDDTFYKIEYKGNDSEVGTLSFISGELDVRAIDRIDSYLLPVCDIENISKRDSANNIELETPGAVIRKENQWEIDTKVKIRFI